MEKNGYDWIRSLMGTWRTALDLVADWTPAAAMDLPHYIIVAMLNETVRHDYSSRGRRASLCDKT
jgi:hypothetical protein